jgi:nucleoside-diphosphate-sugar epimerase
MGDTVLVTGGSGFIGGWCVDALLDRGFDVRATARSAEAAARIQAVTPAVDVAIADLSTDDGWAAAVEGCRYVLHVASPLGAGGADDPDAIIRPARDGTVRVVRAAAAAGIERVVVTSACAAAQPGDLRADVVTDETLWTDPDAKNLTPYRRSKVLAERAAWDTIATHDGPTTLTTVLPGAVFGPLRSADTVGSVAVIAALLTGRMPGLPRFGYQVVDVRDLADLHIRAMTHPEAAGERFIGAGELQMTADIAAILRAHLGDAAARVPTRKVPDTAVRALARVDANVRSLLPALGRRHRHTAAKAERMLGWTPRPAAETIIECARSLVDHGLI